MKKIIFFLCLMFFAEANTFSQCPDCQVVIPLADNDFSAWDNTDEYFLFTCSPSDMLGGITGPVYTHGYTFQNADLPNWYRGTGTPGITRGFSTSGPSVVNLRTTSSGGVGSGSFECGAYGSQGIFANYPFLAHALYSITLNFDYYSVNACLDAYNASIGVSPANGLTETPASNYVESIPSLPAASSFTPWYVTSSTPTSVYNLPPSFTFCQNTALTTNMSQLYIYAKQDHLETWVPYSDGEHYPLGMGLGISSVDVKLCNTCNGLLYDVVLPTSADPASGAAFSSGGLFIDAAITIDGSNLTNPAPSTLLWAKYITVDATGTHGNSFVASAKNGGIFFEMLPNPSCGKATSNSGCSISGPNCISAGGSVVLTGSPAGGTWSISDPTGGDVTVSSSGEVDADPSTPDPTYVVVTYTSGECSYSFTVTVSSDICGGRMTQNTSKIISKQNVANDMILVTPNPTHNNININFPCKSAGQLIINIRDASGRLIYTETVNCNEGNNTKQQIDMSTFDPGVYFVDITLNDQHVVKKIVKL